ncbi:MAG: hypothetical protein J5I53_00420 [Bradyrhizobiaceae bacterium]|nr:hypothetical protein [Bradyrhizobiaceae bacterium]
MNRLLLLFVALSTIVVACSDSTSPKSNRADVELAVVTNYANMVYESYTDAKFAANGLHSALFTFTQAPSEFTLQAAKDAYIKARKPYLQTEVYRLYGGPIDDANGPESLINGWPMDEGYVDYIKDNPDAGIINRPDLYPTIDKQLLESLNEAGGETNISCGFHAIEFLLWGQDFSTSSAGTRSYTDYVESTTGPGIHAKRRAAYLMAAIGLLVDHLTYLSDAWADAPGTYRSQFLADPHKSTELILTGLMRFTFGELAGERMAVALSTADQEDEHSCFSDQTDVDIKLDLQGIVNVLNGTYVSTTGSSISGKGILSLIESVDEATAKRIQDQIPLTVAACDAIQAPFDNELLNDAGRARVQAAIKSLNLLAATVQDGALKLGFVISGELPE